METFQDPNVNPDESPAEAGYAGPAAEPAALTGESVSAAASESPTGAPFAMADDSAADRAAEIADLRKQLEEAQKEIKRLNREMELQVKSAFESGRNTALGEMHTQRVAYYRDLREAGARAAGRMPDTEPATLLTVGRRRGFWD